MQECQLIHYPFANNQSIQPDTKSIVVLDSLLYSTHQVHLPKISTSRAKRAATYALEDELLQSIDELSVFVDKKTDELWSVIVIANEVLEALREAIAEKQIDCQAVIPEFMCLPLLENKVSYMEQDDGIVFRSGRLNGGKIDQTLFFQLYPENTVLSESIVAHHQGFNFLRINLWQKYRKYVQQFKSSAMVLASVLILSIIVLVLENQQLSKNLQAKIQANTALFQSVFPKVNRIVDLPVQLDNQLAKLEKQQHLLNQDFLLVASKYAFDQQSKHIEFENNQLKVSK